MKNILRNTFLALFAIAVLFALGCDNYEQEIAAIEKEFAGYGLSERWQKGYGANNSKFVYHYRNGDVAANRQLVVKQQTHFIFSFLTQLNHALDLRLQDETGKSDSLLTHLKNLAEFFNDQLNDSFLMQEFKYCESLENVTLEKRKQLKDDYRASKTLEAFFKVLEKAKENKDRKHEVDILRRILQLLHSESKYAEAIQYGKEGLEIANQINYRYQQAQILRRLGNSCINISQYDMALNYFERGMEVAKSLQDKSEEMKLHGRIGIVYIYKGLRANALSYLNRAIFLCDSLEIEYYRNQLHNDRGLNLMWMGLYESALEDFRNAFESTDLPLNQGTVLANMGWLYKELGNVSDADSVLNQAYDLIQDLEIKSELANILHNLGDNYVRMDSLETALNFFQHGIDVIDANINEGGDPLYRFATGIRISEGNTYLKAAENALQNRENITNTNELLRLARGKFEQAERLLENFLSPEMPDQVLLGKGKVLLLSGQYQSALEVIRRILSRKKEDIDPLTLIDAQYTLSQIYQQRGNTEAAENALREAINIADAVAENVDDENRLNYYDKRQHIYDRLILHLFNDSRYEDAFMSVEGSRARSLIDNIKAKELFGAAEDTVSDVAAILSSLGDRIQLVEYKVTENDLLIFFFNEDSFYTPLKVPVSRDTLYQLVLNFRKAIGADDNKAFEDKIKIDPAAQFARGAKAGAYLYEYLIAPVTKWLDPEKILYIVPDEILCYVPFDGLQNSPQGERFLVEDYTIAYSPSAIVLKYVLNHSQSGISAENDTFFGIANPTFDLPETETELKNSAKYFSKENVNTPEPYQVNEETVRGALAEKPAVVQFSTHANTSSGNSRYHSIVVGRQAKNTSSAMRNLYVDPAANKSFNDDLLMVYEIQEMDLKGVKFINLPGCNTGGGLMYRGEGVVGITSAFMKAGVPSVMSTLWKIYDRESQQLVSEFFAHWMTTTGISRAKALQQAKQKIIQEYRNKQQYPFPHRWAAFIINGDGD